MGGPIWRKHGKKFAMTANHPYHAELHRRHHARRKAHFTTGQLEHTAMDVSMTTADASTQTDKSGRHREAQMIPGLVPGKVYGFPNSIITTMRYSGTFNLTSTAGSLSTNVFAANGIFDPDITGGGHQPLYRDQYTVLYDQYVVLGAKITLHACNTTSVSGVILGLTGDDDSTLSSNSDTRREQNNSISTLLGPATGGHSTAVLTQTFEPLTDFGVDAKDDGSSATNVGSNPSELWCWGAWATSVDGASTNVVNCMVMIEYTVKFSELTTPTQS